MEEGERGNRQEEDAEAEEGGWWLEEGVGPKQGAPVRIGLMLTPDILRCL